MSRMLVGSRAGRRHRPHRQGVPVLAVLHDDKAAAFMLTDIVDGADVGVVERGSGTSFTEKALHRLRILRGPSREGT